LTINLHKILITFQPLTTLWSSHFWSALDRILGANDRQSGRRSTRGGCRVRQAARATRRRKLIMTARWTEACLSFPALDALREGFDVYPVVDAVRVAARLES
jgi:hypothetical protein